MYARTILVGVVGCLIWIGAGVANGGEDASVAPAAHPRHVARAGANRQQLLHVPTGPHETPVPPPVDNTAGVIQQTSPGRTVTFGRFTSVQVNVNANGENVRNDAANEPSVTIDPTDPNKMAVGWRQFNTISSSFRQAGNAFSQDGGQTWNFHPILDEGQFRSDPVLASDAEGNFYYSSLSTVTTAEVFKSTDGGVTWGVPVPAFGGDKQWIAVDRTGGIGSGNIYQIWNVQFSCCPPGDFTRSTNGGAFFRTPIAIPQPSMKWGTMDVGPDGRLFLAGATLNQTSHVIARSSNVQSPIAVPVFDFVNNVNLGGATTTGNQFFGPNPAGLLGQVWVATDHSGGATHGNVYILGSVFPFAEDPLDVHIIRSTDGGLTWSEPVRVNDDPTDNGAYQWLAAISVAPNGRIDATWYDTRNDFDAINSELYYSFSLDAGATWHASVPVTPPFDHFVGFPQQAKMGDYTHMISDAGGASLAYAATFNGEEDIYFVRLTPDCNDNGVADETDISGGFSDDCNGNAIPDECEPDADCNGNEIQDICDIADGFSEDCNGNMIPDSCEADADCNSNSVQDICDIAAGAADCDGNDVPDECEIAASDCNDNEELDVCEVRRGASPDCNGNEIPDECDVASGASSDDNGNGVPDECDGACCSHVGCSIETRATCAAIPGSFAGAGSVCDQIVCANRDRCVDAEELPSVESLSVPFSNVGAGLDGPTFEGCDNGTQQFGADIWYSYDAPCDGTMTASLCDGTSFDSIMAIYGGECECVCPMTINTGLLGCSDDSCGTGGGPSTLTVPVTRAGCYLIRVAGWSGSTGVGTMNILTTCAVDGCGEAPAPAAVPDDTLKSRYLTIVPPQPVEEGSAIALRVTASDVPAGYEALVGSSFWVEEPFRAPDSVDPPTTFQTARLGCTPLFRQWAAPDAMEVEPVSLFDAAIVPGAVYRIEAVQNPCSPDADCTFSAPLFVTTGQWGDAIAPFAAEGAAQPDFSDIAALVDKFTDADNAPPKNQTDLVPREPDQVVDFSDIAAAVDAFAGVTYSFAVPDRCP